MTRLRRTGLHDQAIIYALAVTLSLIAPFAVFLTANNYSITAPEVWPVYLLAVLPGLLTATCLRLGYFRLASFGLWGGLTAAIGLMIVQISAPVAVFVAVTAAIFVWLLRQHAAQLILLAAVVHLATTIGLTFFAPGADRSLQEVIAPSHEPLNAALPPVVHLAFDEMAGPLGLVTADGDTEQLSSRIEEAFIARNFNVYGRAYSQYMSTSDSLSNLFNFDSSAVSARYYSRPERRPVLSENRFFEHLNASGYAIKVYESSHLDFCSTPGAPVAACSRYQANSIAAIRDQEFDGVQKPTFILQSFLESAPVWRALRKAYNAGATKLPLDLPVWPIGNSHTGPLTSLPAIRNLEQDLSTLRNGEYYFAHLMLPHYPYALNADCSIKNNLEGWLYRAPRPALGSLLQQNDSASRILRYTEYVRQYQCTLNIVEKLFDAIKISRHWQDAIIIVHGDHGSRITRRFPDGIRDAYSADDFRDVYSTFFASRTPDTEGAALVETIPLQAALGRIWNIDFPIEPEPRVYRADLGRADLVAIKLQGFD